MDVGPVKRYEYFGNTTAVIATTGDNVKIEFRMSSLAHTREPVTVYANTRLEGGCRYKMKSIVNVHKAEKKYAVVGFTCG